MEVDAETYIKSLQNEVEEEKARRVRYEQQQGATMFSSEENDNLVKWQLDIKEELERVEHLLRKHVPKLDGKGNMYYVDPTEEEQLFNEYGVQEILNLLAWYLNKNIVLSDFTEEEINLRVWQFGKELVDFIYNNYDKFGLNTPDKIKHFSLVSMNVINTIEASYHRALEGKERESLRTARVVSQSENLNPNQAYPNMPKQNKFSIFKPTTW